MSTDVDLEELLVDTVLVQCRINGRRCEAEVEPASSLLDLLREHERLTGTHMGCMTGHCGACTVLVDGEPVKSCITPAVSVQRQPITTIEGLGSPDAGLAPIQQAFWDAAGFQCGYCAPGMLLCVARLLEENPDPDDAAIRHAIAGNLCRCTGYQSIVRAARAAAAKLRDE